MLSGINESYKLEEKANSDGSVRILMTSDDDFADYISVELLLNPAGVPVSITALDFAENESITRFTDGRFVPLTDSLFTLSHPDDAEIIDMRQ
jgi:outer membrane lipoprotein-sorting protein